MLVDANLLIYAVNRSAVAHETAATWLADRLINGSQRVGLPWQSLTAFLRISTHPRAFEHPLEGAVAWALVADWLAAPAAWTPRPGDRYADLLGGLITRYDVRANLVPDAELSALALEHGLMVCSADTDFARFDEVRWENPLA